MPRTVRCDRKVSEVLTANGKWAGMGGNLPLQSLVKIAAVGCDFEI
jgi:hypothetical protein